LGLQRNFTFLTRRWMANFKCWMSKGIMQYNNRWHKITGFTTCERERHMEWWGIDEMIGQLAPEIGPLYCIKN
jgi:hypothetical protein